MHPDLRPSNGGRTAPVVVAATIAAVACLLFTSTVTTAMALGNIPSQVTTIVAPSPTSLPIAPRFMIVPWVSFLVALLAVAGVMALLTWVATRSQPPGTARAAVFLAIWFAAVGAGAVAGLLSGLIFTMSYRMDLDMNLPMVLSRQAIGLRWGVQIGWLVAAVAILVDGRGRRGLPPPTVRAPQPPGRST